MLTRKLLRELRRRGELCATGALMTAGQGADSRSDIKEDACRVRQSTKCLRVRAWTAQAHRFEHALVAGWRVIVMRAVSEYWTTDTYTSEIWPI